METLSTTVRDYSQGWPLTGRIRATGDTQGGERGAPALKPGGFLVMEIDHGQGEACLEMMRETGCWSETRVLRDYAGRQRVVVGRKAGLREV